MASTAEIIIALCKPRPCDAKVLPRALQSDPGPVLGSKPFEQLFWCRSSTSDEQGFDDADALLVFSRWDASTRHSPTVARLRGLSCHGNDMDIPYSVSCLTTGFKPCMFPVPRIRLVTEDPGSSKLPGFSLSRRFFLTPASSRSNVRPCWSPPPDFRQTKQNDQRGGPLHDSARHRRTMTQQRATASTLRDLGDRPRTSTIWRERVGARARRVGMPHEVDNDALPGALVIKMIRWWTPALSLGFGGSKLLDAIPCITQTRRWLRRHVPPHADRGALLVRFALLMGQGKRLGLLIPRTGHLEPETLNRWATTRCPHRRSYRDPKTVDPR